MATATFRPQGKTRALESIRAGKDGVIFPKTLRMNTFPFNSMTPDPVMQRTITWGTHADYVRSTNALTVKTATENSEYADALLFPIAAGRKFSNMTLHLADSGYPLFLTFVLEGAESAVADNYGTAKLVGAITINF